MNIHQTSQQTGELLIHAGWSTGLVSDPKGFRVDWTDEGLERLRHLFYADIGALQLDPDQTALLLTWAALAGQAHGWDEQQDASAEAEWTDETPTAPGFYWFRSAPEAQAELVNIVTSDQFLHPSQRGSAPVSLFVEVFSNAHPVPVSHWPGGLWFGPINPP